jgi:hypothetical protein
MFSSRSWRHLVASAPIGHITGVARTLRRGPSGQSFWPHARRRYDTNTRHDTPERTRLSRWPLRACASRTGACRNWLHGSTPATLGGRIARASRHGAKGASDSEVRASAAGSPSPREQATSATLRVRSFTTLQHIDQCGHFPRTSSRCFHVGGAKRECIEVLPPQMAGDLQHQAAAQRARLQAACPCGL